MHTYTPGPWTVELDADGNTINICSDTLPYVASTWGDGSSPTIEQAFNARLISAAPDLLFALIEAQAYLDGERVERYAVESVMRAAIAKATGGQA